MDELVHRTVPSPNWDERKLPISMVVLHYTEMASAADALARLTDLADEYPGHRELVDQLRSRYEHEASHVWPHGDGPRDEDEQERLDHLEIRTAVLDAEREAVIRMRGDGIISDEVLHSIERDLDLEALRSGV